MAKAAELPTPEVERTKIYADIMQAPVATWKCKCGQVTTALEPKVVAAIASGGHVDGRCGKCDLTLRVMLSKVKQAVQRNKGTKRIVV